MISANWTRENIAWAAGLFEGEGCTFMHKRRSTSKAPVVGVTMTDKDVLEKLHRIIGLGSLNGPFRGANGRKDSWRWSCTGSEQAQAVLAAFWPFLCSRRQAKITEILGAIAMIPMKSSAKRFCPSGHAYSPENTHIHVSGSRRCKECARRRALKAYHLKNPGAKCRSQLTPN